MRAQTMLIAAAGVILALGVALVWHWSPERQVRLHQRDFLRAVESRDWSKVGEFVARDYRDAWGQSREELLGRLPDGFRDFLACGILMEEAVVVGTPQGREVRAKIRVVGSGGPIAQTVLQTSEELREPFGFEWRQTGRAPWAWQLVAVSQPELGAF